MTTPSPREPDAREALASPSLEGLTDWLAHMQTVNQSLRHVPEMAEHLANLARWEAALRHPAAAGGEPVAMLGGINGVSLMRHIENMQPDYVRKEYHTPLYKHPSSDERAKVWNSGEREAVARALFGDGWQCCSDLGPYVQGIVTELNEARQDAAAAEKGR